MKFPITLIVIVILLGILGPQAFYTVDETHIVVVRRFGEIQDVHTTPGLRVKTPFVDSVTRLDRRVLRVDAPEATLPDIELQFLTIDAYTRYRIRPNDAEATKFFEKLRTLPAAEERIGRIVVSALREEVAKRKRRDIIGAIIEETPEGERKVIATNTRQEILDNVLAAARRAVDSPENDFGVDILDVRIKRADFPNAIQDNIFARMRAERDRISKELRAEGQEERDKIEAAANRDRTIILADARKDSDITRGEGEGEAIKIFAEALEQNPEFFAFQRSLEAYKTFLSTNATVVLSSDSVLFQFLQDPEGSTGSPFDKLRVSLPGVDE
jgi:membrane protease subunit HflC